MSLVPPNSRKLVQRTYDHAELAGQLRDGEVLWGEYTNLRFGQQQAVPLRDREEYEQWVTRHVGNFDLMSFWAVPTSGSQTAAKKLSLWDKFKLWYAGYYHR